MANLMKFSSLRLFLKNLAVKRSTAKICKMADTGINPNGLANCILCPHNRPHSEGTTHVWENGAELKCIPQDYYRCHIRSTIDGCSLYEPPPIDLAAQILGVDSRRWYQKLPYMYGRVAWGLIPEILAVCLAVTTSVFFILVIGIIVQHALGL